MGQSISAAELNAQNDAKRAQYLAAAHKPTTTKWNGRNPVGGASGFDTNGHRSSGGGIGNN